MILGQLYCCPLCATQRASQQTGVSLPTPPTLVSYDQDWLLSVKQRHTELSPLVRDTLRQLGIHSSLPCRSKKRKRRPCRAGQRKQRGRTIPVLISHRKELSRPDRCFNSSTGNHDHLIRVLVRSSSLSKARGLKVLLFNARSVGKPEKLTEPRPLFPTTT